MTHRLIQRTLQLNGQPLTFFHPENDDSVFGTLSCLQQGRFHFDAVTFGADDVVVDIGSNIGLVSLVLARINPAARVLAFDASRLSIECLRRSVAANNLTNVESYHLAIGDADQRDVSFFSNGKDLSCLVEQGLNTSNPVLDSTVNKVSIDTLFDSLVFGIERVKYAKVDVEGAEYQIFNRLFDKRPDILDRISYLHLEIHPYQEYDPEGLKAKVLARFGERVFLDT